MDRVITYPDEMASDTDGLLTNKSAMVAFGVLIRALAGTGTLVDGFACVPGTGLTVSVAAGAIFSLIATDATGYGSLGTDAVQMMKEGHVRTATVLSTPVPGTVGQSINYLIQVQYQDVDGGLTLLPYYDAGNPLVPYSGPGNDGIPQDTVRQGVAVLAVKAGTPATTGTQTTPAPDAGYTPLWDVTVAHTDVSVSAGNIVRDLSAPFIGGKVGQIAQNDQAAGYNFGLGDHDTTIRLPFGAGTQTWTIPANSAVSLPKGYEVHGVVDSGCTLHIAITTDTLSYAAGSLGGAGATRTITAGSYPIPFRLYKYSATGWLLDAPVGVT